MGGQPARNDAMPRALSVRCPFCQEQIEVKASPPVTLPCPGCGKLLSIKQG